MDDNRPSFYVMGNADVPDDLDMMDWDQMDISVYDQGAIVTGCLSI